MRSWLNGNIARQVSLGRGIFHALSRPRGGAPSGRAGGRSGGRPLPISTAVPLWGVLSILGWLVAAHLTVGMMNPEERRQFAAPRATPAVDRAPIDFVTAAGPEQH